MSEVQTLMTELVMGESPRWHDDRLWLSDMGREKSLLSTSRARARSSPRPERPDGYRLYARWAPAHRHVV